MNTLTQDQLHRLRLVIFDNAESLRKEADLLFHGGYYARAYLLAHFATEELGKIPIVVGVIGRRIKKEEIDWKHTMKRFRNHKEKIDSNDFHQYMFGIDLDLIRNSDLQWLKAARANSDNRVDLKNLSTYVEVQNGNVSSPLTQVSKEEASAMLQRAFDSLKAHWHAESLTNPVVIAAQKAGPSA